MKLNHEYYFEYVFEHHLQEDVIEYLIVHHWYYILGLRETRKYKDIEKILYDSCKS